MSGGDERRVKDPLDLEAPPGQARVFTAEDADEVAVQGGPAADPQGRGRDDSAALELARASVRSYFRRLTGSFRVS